MKREIVTNIKDLKRVADFVNESDDVDSIIKDLEDTLIGRKGYGLAAPQIGISKQVAIIRMQGCEANIINPIILEKEDKIVFRGEQCFSFPGLSIDTDRYANIVVEFGLPNNRTRASLQGMEAIVFQHELDHLTGITILDMKHRKRR